MTKKTSGPPSGRYRNPPEHARFRKGQSGNPKGRPKGSKNFRTLVEQELDQQVELSENGKSVRLSKRQIIAKKLVNEAATGNPRAWRELLPMISGTSEADTVELNPVTSAMIASYLARYHGHAGAEEDKAEADEGSAQEKGEDPCEGDDRADDDENGQ